MACYLWRRGIGEEVLQQAKEVVFEAPAVFRASVAIREGRNPQPLAVAVYSVDEPNSSKGAWGNSDFIVFRSLRLPAWPTHFIMNAGTLILADKLWRRLPWRSAVAFCINTYTGRLSQYV